MLNGPCGEGSPLRSLGVSWVIGMAASFWEF